MSDDDKQLMYVDTISDDDKQLMYVGTIDNIKAIMGADDTFPGGPLERLVVWTCECAQCSGEGVEGAIVFGRNRVAIWVGSTHSRSPTHDRFLGLESVDEISEFCHRVEQMSPTHTRGLCEALIAEFRRDAPMA